MQNRNSLMIDVICQLSANPQHDATIIAAKLDPFKKNPQDPLPFIAIDINAPGSHGFRMVEHATLSGSLSTLRYLIENQKASLRAGFAAKNLVELALSTHQFDKVDYLLEVDARRWQQFDDGTTEFLAHVLAGRYEAVQQMLDRQPDLICQQNLRFENALSLSARLMLCSQHTNREIRYQHIQQLLLSRLQRYEVINLAALQYGNLADYYSCMALYYSITHSSQLSLAEESYRKSIEYYSTYLLSPQYLQLSDAERDAIGLKMSATLLMKGRLMMKLLPEKIATATSTTLIACIESFELGYHYLQNIKEKHPVVIDVQDNLLREWAASCYRIDNYYMLQAETNGNPRAALDNGYLHCISYGEAALRACFAIQGKTPADHNALTASIDKLIMTYSSVKNIYRELVAAFADDNITVTYFNLKLEEFSHKLDQLLALEGPELERFMAKTTQCGLSPNNNIASSINLNFSALIPYAPFITNSFTLNGMPRQLMPSSVTFFKDGNAKRTYNLPTSPKPQLKT